MMQSFFSIGCHGFLSQSPPGLEQCTVAGLVFLYLVHRFPSHFERQNTFTIKNQRYHQRRLTLTSQKSLDRR